MIWIAYLLIGFLIALVRHRVWGCGDEEVFFIVTMWPLSAIIRGLEWGTDMIMKLLEWNRRIGR